MKRLQLTIVVLTVLAGYTLPTAAARFTLVDAKVAPNLFLWTDTCNVYVLREGAAALLIGLGDGSLLNHLGEARKPMPVRYARVGKQGQWDFVDATVAKTPPARG